MRFRSLPVMVSTSRMSVVRSKQQINYCYGLATNPTAHLVAEFARIPRRSSSEFWRIPLRCAVHLRTTRSPCLLPGACPGGQKLNQAGQNVFAIGAVQGQGQLGQEQ